jgi:hypothetical protein
MKLLVRLSIIGLAAFGARTLYERLRPRGADATGAGPMVGSTLAPAVREAASSVRNASTHAAHEVAGAARETAEELKDVATGKSAAAAGHPARSPLPGATTGDGPFGEPAAPGPAHPLSTMAARDLGLDDPSAP